MSLQRLRALGVEHYSIPSLPALLNLVGIYEVEGSLDLLWTCCGLYEVKVGGGGLRSELPAEPTRSPGMQVSPSSLGLGLENLLGSGRPVNVYSWSPLALVSDEIVKAGNCIRTDEGVFCRPEGNPWSPLRDPKIYDIVGLSGPGKEATIGHLVLVDMREFSTLGGFTIIEGAQASGAGLGSSWTLRLNGCAMAKHNHYDVAADVLYPFMFYRTRLRPGDKITVNSIALYFNRPLAISSPKPLTLTFRPGELELCPSKEGQEVMITEGSEVEAFRLLLESTTIIKGQGGVPLGSVRAGPAAALLLGYSDGTVRALIVNPTHNDAQVTIRLRKPFRGGLLMSLLGVYEIPKDIRGLARVPAPSGCLCLLELKV